MKLIWTILVLTVFVNFNLYSQSGIDDALSTIGELDTIQVKALISVNDIIQVKKISEVRRKAFVAASSCDTCLDHYWKAIWNHQKYLTSDRKEIPINWIIWNVRE